jgi:hypothetical protein
MRTVRNKKLEELVLYIAERSEGDQPFGKTKLNKILFQADFIYFAETGRSITGQEYVKQPYGPVPVGIEETLETLRKGRSLAIARRRYLGFLQQRPLALREPNLAGFSGHEIAVVDRVISELWDLGAKIVSDLSHKFIGWQIAEMGEVIPYETVLIDTSPPTESEEEYARQLTQMGR